MVLTDASIYIDINVSVYRCKRIMDCEDVVRGGTIDIGRQQYGMMVGIYSAWWQSVISWVAIG